jgi:hypothetical protein
MNPVDPKAFLEQCATVAAEHHEKMAHAAGAGGTVTGLRDRLRDILNKIWDEAKAKGLNIDLWKLISLIPQIIALISGGGSWMAIVQAILAILSPPAPTPAPGATP